MHLKDVEILENQKVAKGIYKLTFKSPEIANEASEGQFLEIKVAQGISNLLRKPISINNIKGNKVSIIYKVIGKGTQKLAKFKKGEKLNVLGPLGNGFPSLNKDELKNKKKELLLVAGGIGYAPFSYIMDKYENWKLFYGSKNKKELLLDDYNKRGNSENLIITTDDGSFGKKGYITEELKSYLEKNKDKKEIIIFVCGPEIMMKKIAMITCKYNVLAYLSLETYMGCGIGACVGCVQKIKNEEKKNGWEHKKVCQDGPVFKASEVIWQ
ncbi:MAG: dihydroorotate dehydrogenase electron transfer subunit [Fusobacteriota bacterium]